MAGGNEAGPGVLLVGHGSRSAQAAQELEAVVEVYRAHSRATVTLAFLEHQSPRVDVALARMLETHDEVVVAPLLLFAAGHMHRDLPRYIDRARDGSRARVHLARELGTQPEMMDVALARLAEQDSGLVPDKGQGTLVLVLGRGASEPGAVAAFLCVVEKLGRALPQARVEAAFLDVTTPSLQTQLMAVSQAPDVRQLVVLPFLLFGGTLVDRARDQLQAWASGAPLPPWRLARPLGADPHALASLLRRRVEEAAGLRT